MKIEKQELENHQVKIIAEFEADTLVGFKRKAARKIAKEYKIPGFRPGKAPYEVIKRNFGEETIQKQAIELMLDDVYPKVLEEADIKPAGPGSLDNINSEEPPVFEFSIPLMPEVELSDYNDIRIDYDPELVSDEDVEAVIENLKQGYATAVPVERAAKEGDVVSIKIKGRIEEPDEDEDPEIVKETPYQVIVGEEKEENNWPFDGFSKEVAGVLKDETKKITHKYDEDTSFSRFAGKEIEYEYLVESVKEMEYPEMNDEFAQSLGDYETMEDLRKAIRENLETSKQEEYDQDYVSRIIDQIVQGSTIKYAQITLEEEMESVLQSVQQDLGNQNLDLETYLKIRNTDQKTFMDEEIKPVAEQRLQRSLILDEAARREGIEISEDELQAGVTNMMTQLFNMPGFEKPRSDQDLRKLTNAVSFDTASRILNEKILDRLIAIAKGEGDLEVEPAEPESEAPEVPEESSGEEVLSTAKNKEEDTPTSEAVEIETEEPPDQDQTAPANDENNTETSEVETDDETN